MEQSAANAVILHHESINRQPENDVFSQHDVHNISSDDLDTTGAPSEEVVETTSMPEEVLADLVSARVDSDLEEEVDLKAARKEQMLQAVKGRDPANVAELMEGLGADWCAEDPEFAGQCIVEAANLYNEDLLKLLLGSLPEEATLDRLSSGAKSLANEDGHHAYTIASVLEAICKYIEMQNLHGLKIMDIITNSLLQQVPCLAGMTPMHFMGIGDSPNLLQRSLSLGMDSMVKDARGCTPLHYAALFARKAAAETLLAKGAHHTVTNIHGRMPLSLAAANGHDEIVHLLLKRQESHGVGAFAIEKDAENALIMAAANGHSKAVEMLLDFNAVEVETPALSKAVLNAAVKNGHCDMVSLLLSRNAVVYPTCVHLAVETDQEEVLYQLLSCSEDGMANATVVADGVTPLMVACQSGASKEMVQMLLDFGADVMLRDADGNGVIDFLERNESHDPKVMSLLKGAICEISAFVEYRDAYYISKTAPFWKDTFGGYVPAMDKAGNSVSIWFYRHQDARDRAAVIANELDPVFACTIAGTWETAIFGDHEERPEEPYALATVAGEKNLQEMMDEFRSTSRGLADAETRCIFASLVNSVEHLHSRGFIHHNLTPSAFIRFFDGRFRLFGFHTAYMQGERISQPARPEVCPPEVSHAFSVDEPIMAAHAADVWALGCILYQLLTSRSLLHDLVEAAGMLGGKMAKDATAEDNSSPKSRSSGSGTTSPVAAGSQRGRSPTRSSSMKSTASVTSVKSNSGNATAAGQTVKKSVSGGSRRGWNMSPVPPSPGRNHTPRSMGGTPASTPGSKPRAAWLLPGKSPRNAKDLAHQNEELMSFLAWQLDDKIVSRVLTRVTHKPSRLAQHAASLLRAMLRCNPAKRCTMKDIKESKLLTADKPLQASASDLNMVVEADHTNILLDSSAISDISGLESSAVSSHSSKPITLVAQRVAKPQGRSMSSDAMVITLGNMHGEAPVLAAGPEAPSAMKKVDSVSDISTDLEQMSFKPNLGREVAKTPERSSGFARCLSVCGNAPLTQTAHDWSVEPMAPRTNSASNTDVSDSQSTPFSIQFTPTPSMGGSKGNFEQLTDSSIQAAIMRQGPVTMQNAQTPTFHIPTPTPTAASTLAAAAPPAKSPASAYTLPMPSSTPLHAPVMVPTSPAAVIKPITPSLPPLNIAAAQQQQYEALPPAGPGTQSARGGSFSWRGLSPRKAATTDDGTPAAKPSPKIRTNLSMDSHMWNLVRKNSSSHQRTQSLDNKLPDGPLSPAAIHVMAATDDDPQCRCNMM